VRSGKWGGASHVPRLAAIRRPGPSPAPRAFAFGAYDADHGWELWRSDATAAGTVRVVDLNPGTGDGLYLPK
jgi:ELWxxDGT repeat protein